MPLREAVSFLKGAVTRSLPGGAPSVYIFSGGVMYAQSASTLAAYPVSHVLGTFGLSADDLESAIGRMPTEPAVEAGDGTLILRAGRLRSTIDLFAAEPPPHGVDDTNWDAAPEGLLPAIARALPFASKDGTWNRGVELVAGGVRACSNAHACFVEVPIAVDGPTALTDDAASYLAKLPEPQGWKRLGSALAFSWPAGAWVRCQLMAQTWPAIVDDIMKWADAETPVTITDEWREAFADIKALGEGTVDIGPDAMVGRSAHAEHRAEFATGVAGQTRWQLKALENVLDVADRWAPDAPRAAFAGPGARGVAAGMQR